MEITHSSIEASLTRRIVDAKKAEQNWDTIINVFCEIEDILNQVITRWKPRQIIFNVEFNDFTLSLIRDKGGDNFLGKIFSSRRRICWHCYENYAVQYMIEFPHRIGTLSLQQITIINKIYKALPDIIETVDKVENCQDLGIAKFFAGHS